MMSLLGEGADMATKLILPVSESDRIRKFPRLLCRGNPNWFNNTTNYLTNYVMQRDVSDRDLTDFLQIEGLEDDFQHFQSRMHEWTKQVREMLPPNQNFMIGKVVAMIELERIRKFLYAVVLNKPELLHEHDNTVTQVIHNAATQKQPTNHVSLLPCISSHVKK
jgi:hypothetical protein